LSGGQKQRVNIARALYFDADIVLFDDPLSAVDAHVGKSLFQVRHPFLPSPLKSLNQHTTQNAILDGLRARGKTVVLVTHALHFLAEVDFIYTMENGCIVEQGSYENLMTNDGPFATLMHDFGGVAQDEEEEEAAVEEEAIEEVAVEGRPVIKRLLTKDERAARKAAGTGKEEGKLIEQEKRDIGSIKSTGMFSQTAGSSRCADAST
jgi:ATP-binding cassette subfamily C (CFTR/MRP) protein 1